MRDKRERRANLLNLKTPNTKKGADYIKHTNTDTYIQIKATKRNNTLNKQIKFVTLKSRPKLNKANIQPNCPNLKTLNRTNKTSYSIKYTPTIKTYQQQDSASHKQSQTSNRDKKIGVTSSKPSNTIYIPPLYLYRQSSNRLNAKLKTETQTIKTPNLGKNEEVKPQLKYIERNWQRCQEKHIRQSLRLTPNTKNTHNNHRINQS